MKKLLIILSLLFVITLLSSLEFSPVILNFTNSIVGHTDSLSLSVTNDSNTEHNFQIINHNQFITSQISSISLNPQETKILSVYLNSNTNIEVNDILFFVDSENSISEAIPIHAEVHFADNYYSSTYNLYDNELKNALLNLINNQNSLGYTGAREAMFGDIDNVNGVVTGVYTGFQVETTGIPNGNIMNCEHTWPQSLGATGVAKSDLNHLFPCKSSANSARGSLPFGNVVNQNWEDGGSLRGSDANGTTVFEPRDIHKGDCARAMIYFSIRYNNPHNFLNYQEETLREWFWLDPVSQKELDRNDAVESYQNNRNPFIDHPHFLDRIFSISSNQTQPINPEIYLPENEIIFENPIVASIDTSYIELTNIGNGEIEINAIQSNSEVISFGNFDHEISSEELIKIPVLFYSDTPATYNGNVNISTSLGNYTIGFTADCSENSIHNQIAKPIKSKITIFPNPYSNKYKSGTIKIRLSSKKNQIRTISIYNLKGQLIKKASNLNTNEYHWNMKNSINHNVANGIYFVNINNDRNLTKKLLLLK
jgi:endonuclease I